LALLCLEFFGRKSIVAKMSFGRRNRYNFPTNKSEINPRSLFSNVYSKSDYIFWIKVTLPIKIFRRLTSYRKVRMTTLVPYWCEITEQFSVKSQIWDHSSKYIITEKTDSSIFVFCYKCFHGQYSRKILQDV
jgi:hypothetical protein